MTSNESFLELVNRHSNFYWLAKYLKEAATQHGTNISEGKIVAFYHGINKELIFPKLLTSNGVKIFGPLSTSSSYQVAANFALNNGLIIEFSDGSSGNKAFPVKYFSCSWLSDYANEMEYLFLQLKYGGLKFVNITHIMYSMDFHCILESLKIIDHFTNGACYNQHKLSTNAIRIIKNQLSRHVQIYHGIKSLHPYAQKLINVFCHNKKMLNIDINYCCEYEWICIIDLMNIFPNVATITMINVNSDAISLQQKNFIKYVNVNEKTNLKHFIVKSSNLTVSCTTENHSIHHKIDSASFEQALHLLDYFTNFGNAFYGNDLHSFVLSYLCRLIGSKINNGCNDDTIHYENGKELFDTYCHRKLRLALSWAVVTTNICKPLFDIFCISEDKWIGFDFKTIIMLNKLFPNLNSLLICGVDLCQITMKNILYYLQNRGNSKIDTILLITISISDINIKSVINEYRHAFAKIRFKIYEDENIRDCVCIQSTANNTIKLKKPLRVYGKQLNGKNMKDLSVTLGSLVDTKQSISVQLTHTQLQKSSNRNEGTVTTNYSTTNYSTKRTHDKTNTLVPVIDLPEDIASDIQNDKLFDLFLKMIQKWQLYVPMILHICVTATLFGVIYDWINIVTPSKDFWTKEFTPLYFGILAIISIMIYRIMSGIAVWRTLGWKSGIVQMFDVFVYRELYEAFVDEKMRPTNHFRWIRRMEATFHSFPSSLILIAALVRDQGTSGEFLLIIVTMILLLWSTISTIIEDDKWKFGIDSPFRKLCPPHPKYLFRSTFRLCEVCSRVITLSLVWDA
eukprot:271517_1